jgi:integrase
LKERITRSRPACRRWENADVASVVRDPGGRKRIQFQDGPSHQRTIRLGVMSVKQADAIKVRVEQLITTKMTGIADPEAAEWLQGLDARMYAKLARAGLVPPREQVNPTLDRLLDAFFETLDVKPGTATTYKQTRRSLEDYSKTGTLLSAITPLGAARWRQSMKTEGLAEATISKRVKTARQIFKQGMRWKMLRENPLADVRAGSQTNKARMYFVSRNDAARILESCPNSEWRVIFALSRYGGLRCPSEHLALRWSDIDWHDRGMTIRASKTEAYQAGGVRVIPIFPELMPHLREAYELAPEGSEWVVARYRDKSSNLRTQLQRYIERARVRPWPKLFQNLRSSRQTELAASHPIHVVCAWMGNTRGVALDHYLVVRDSDYEAAAGLTAQATQKATQHGAASGRTASQTKGGQAA